MFSRFCSRASVSRILSMQKVLLVGLLALSVGLITTVPAQASLRDLWRSIFDSPPPDPPSPGGSCGDLFCPIAPNALPNTAIVWSDRPTLTWISSPGAVQRVDILQGETVIWSSPISEVHQVQSAIDSSNRAIYQITVSTHLKAGEYQWYALFANNTAPRFARFQVMTTEERDRITQDITQLNQQLERDRTTDDAATLQRANFFANQQLWSEFWDETLSVQNPSAELNTVIAETLTTVCPVLNRE